MEYKGSLKSIDPYMNLQLLNTEASAVMVLGCRYAELIAAAAVLASGTD